ncbi:putative lipid II flippase FtsW [Kibdelosporangium persicum]|uniref:Probable peptidoglycan glycosyltransferase FtsW n=1 Tax=Kibdelosporangium persicum TaxID=2698649 RepID=A0ABX2EWY9_9PSEU|nr:putative lipid II flippase FtsW [Kibdelosporangium persicum]NRN63561.1 Cell division-specific peptidoglycan biosynthesis regulator FtsW [Kibdelosporangium persicum]
MTATLSSAEERKRARQDRRKRAGLLTVLTAWLGRPLASFHLVLAVFGLLTVLGLVMVLSASSVVSLDTGPSVYTVFKKQLLFVAIGSVAFWIALRMPLRLMRQFSAPALAVCFAMLVLVLIVGKEFYGARSWFVVGPISFQPIEVAKLALVLWGAYVLVQKKALLHQYRHLLVPLVPVALLMFALVMMQPDLGGTVTLIVVLFALLWFAGAPMRLFGAAAIGGVAGVVVLSLNEGYRLARVLTFLNPEADPSGKGLQGLQAKYALADGGLFGKGLGQGQSKWEYLPNVHNDFIFALIGEELGFLGCALVLGLFAMLAVVGLRIAARNIDPWIRMVAATLTVWLVGQAAINIAYVVGLLPVTGITLPMISAGGSSIVVTMFVFGILANCARHEPESVAALRSQGPGRFGRLMKLPAPDVYNPPQKRKPVRPSTPPRTAGRREPATRRTGTAERQLHERRRTRRSVPVPEHRRRSARGRTGHPRADEGGRH